MPLITVRQTITPSGKVRIEISNTSGQDGDQQPCSVIFSLRSSHPQFFYCRGLVAENDAASHGSPSARMSANSPSQNGGAQITRLSSMVSPSKCAAALLKASESVWRAEKLPPLPLTDAEMHAASPVTAAAPKNHAAKPIPTAALSERPLLVREELPDGVLLPGEGRVVLLDLDDPEYIDEILSSGRSTSATPRASGTPAEGGRAGGKSVGFAKDGAGGRAESPRSRNADAVSNSAGWMENSVYEPVRLAADGGEASSLSRRKQQSQAAPGSDTDASSVRSSQQPLSITRESATSRGQSAGGSHARLEHTGDGSASSTDVTASVRSDSLGGTHRPGAADRHASGGSGDGRSESRARRTPAFFVLYERLGDEDKCAEHARHWLRKESKKYRAWQDRYIAYVVRLEQRRRQHGGKGSDAARSEGDHAHHSRPSEDDLGRPIPMRGLRIIPPALGEGIRWHRDDGFRHAGSGDRSNTAMQRAYCALAFQYYYGALVGDGTGNGDSSSVGNSLSQHTHAPPLFAAAHTNPSGSKTAQKMFTKSRVGGGTVVLFLSGCSHSQGGARSALNGSDGRNSSQIPSVTAHDAEQPAPSKHSSGSGTRASPAAARADSGAADSHNDSPYDVSDLEGETTVPLVGPRQTTALPFSVQLQQNTARGIADGASPASLSGARGDGGDSAANFETVRVRSGRGLALLDDSEALDEHANNTSGTHSSSAANASADPSANGFNHTLTYPARTATLDPATADALSRGVAPDSPMQHGSASTQDIYAPMQLRNSLPSFDAAGSPLTDPRKASDAAPTSSEVADSSDNPLSLGTASRPTLAAPLPLGNGGSDSSAVGEHGDSSVDLHGSRLLHGGESNGSIASANGGGTSNASFLDTSLARFNNIMKYWLSVADNEEADNDDAAFLEDAEGAGVNADGKPQAKARNLTDAPPMSLCTAQREIQEKRQAHAKDTPERTPAEKKEDAARRRRQIMRKRVSNRVAQAVTIVGNGTVEVITEGLQQARPLVESATDYIMNTFIGSMLPSAVSSVSSFTTDVLFQPDNVHVMVLIVLPIVALACVGLILYTMFSPVGVHGHAISESFYNELL